jgi:hypothetical protein
MAPKRPKYFQSQFLIVRDFEAEQTYHREMLSRHNSLMHDWGVVRDGLVVTRTDTGFKISPGSAIDNLGQEIILESEYTPASDQVPAGQDVFITIAFDEKPSGDSLDKYPPPGGTQDVTRMIQSPKIVATASPVTDGTVIILARVKANGDVDLSGRRQANGFIRTGSNDLYISSGRNVGIGTTTPGFPLAFSDALGDKIALWGQSGNHYGFGIQSALLQIHTEATTSDIAFGYGSSASFTETMRVKGNGKVAIGPVDPQAPLHIKNNAALLNLEGTDHGFVQFYPKGFTAGRKGWLGFGDGGDSHLRLNNEATGNVVLSALQGYIGAVSSGGDGQGIQFGNREIKFRGDGLEHFSIFANKVSNALTFTRSTSNVAMDTVDSHLMTLAKDGNVGIGTTGLPAARLHLGSGALQIGTNPVSVTTIDSKITHVFGDETTPRYTIDRDLLGTGQAGIGFNMRKVPSAALAANGSAVGMPADRTLGFSTSDGTSLVERMRIDSAGNVSIAKDLSVTGALTVTSALSALNGIQLNNKPLQIRAGDENHGLCYFGAGDTTVGDFAFDGPVLYGFSGGALGIKQATTGNPTTRKIAIRWDGSGKVGIGTTNPGFTLQVGDHQSDSVGVICVAGKKGTAWRRWTMRTGDGSDTEVHKLRIRDENANNGGGADRLVIDQDGKVGIGTTSPAEKLTVGVSTAGANYAQDAPVGWRESYKLFRAGAQIASIGTDDTGAKLQLFTGATSGDTTARLTVDNSGNVGIGTQDTWAKLTVKGGSNTFTPSLGGSSGGDIFLWADNNGPWVPAINVGDEVIVLGQRRKVVAVPNDKHIQVDRPFSQTRGPITVIRGAESAAILRADDKAGDTKFFISGNGNVGIGTNNPADATLQIAQPDSATVRRDLIELQHLANNSFLLSAFGRSHPAAASTMQLAAWNAEQSISIVTDSVDNVKAGGSTKGIFIQSGGNVGIGTTNPKRGRVEIVGSLTMSLGRVAFLSADLTETRLGPISVQLPVAIGGDWVSPVSLFADNDIAANRHVAFSDERIKYIQGRSDSVADLHTLLGIEVTDFRYKDLIGKGNGLHKKVIAQQVEKVFPQAVSKQTDVVPDIYQPASFTNGWIELATDLKKGERVKLITEKGEGVHDVIEATPDKFRADFKPEGDKVFVFGREVNDFRNVDYDAIAMLNVSATQQLKKEKDEQVNALRTEIAELQAAKDALVSRLEILESKIATAASVVAAKNGSNGNGRH